MQCGKPKNKQSPTKVYCVSHINNCWPRVEFPRVAFQSGPPRTSPGRDNNCACVPVDVNCGDSTHQSVSTIEVDVYQATLAGIFGS